MKKILAAVVAIVMVMAVSTLPTMASQPTTATVTTSVTISAGGGNPPYIKAKWEQNDTAPLDDDPATGIQFLPPCTYQGKKHIRLFAVINDTESGGDVKMVWANVYHPDGSFKYKVDFVKITDNAQGKAYFDAAVAAKLVTFNDAITQADVDNELDKGVARVWMGEADLDYEQMSGTYTVKDFTLDWQDNPAELDNTFLYIPTTCFAVDNNAINYGPVSISTMKKIPGDTIFSIGDGKMTVRNLGNTNMSVKVGQDDMGFGQNNVGAWNVEFDGRLGHLVTELVYDPVVAKPGIVTPNTVLPGILQHSADDELDFSIHVKNALPGSYSGTMVLSSVIMP
jgi:hypothetical protein